VTSPDAITLSIPRERAFHGVARLVVGGVAARYELSFEHMDDLQLALASVLENDGYGTGQEITVRISIHAESFDLAVGPLNAQELQRDLEAEPDDEISLHRLLSALVDTVELEESEDGAWLRLVKQVPLKHPEDRELA
jgi:anti-sigma regulatory factor (Ser/Thr protein kinase)